MVYKRLIFTDFYKSLVYWIFYSTKLSVSHMLEVIEFYGYKEKGGYSPGCGNSLGGQSSGVGVGKSYEERPLAMAFNFPSGCLI